MVKMGYGGSIKDAGEAVGGSGDGGIDGIIKEDRLGLDIIYIQAKRLENNVLRPDIQKFAGALQGKRAQKGVFIKRSSKSHYVILTKTVQDFADIFFKGFFISRLEFHQFILQLVPILFNSIEFWTVRWQEIKSQPLLSQHL